MGLAMTAEINRDRKKRRKPFTHQDFMLSEQLSTQGQKVSVKTRIAQMIAALGLPDNDGQ